MRDPAKVTRLPTAARRKVQQNFNKRASAARQALREEAPRPGEHIFPSERRMMKVAAELREIKQTPALMIAVAIFKALDQQTRDKVLAAIAPGAVAENQPFQQALTCLMTATLTIGEQLDLSNALQRTEAKHG